VRTFFVQPPPAYYGHVVFPAGVFDLAQDAAILMNGREG